MISCSANSYKIKPPTQEQIKERQAAAARNRQQWEQRQRENQRLAQQQQANAMKQQQLAADQFYDREFRQFLRARNYPNVSAIVASARKYNSYFRENPNASENEKREYWFALSNIEQANFQEIETPKFTELWSEFSDILAQRIAQQQHAQRQQALQAIIQNPITLSPRQPSTNTIIIDRDSNSSNSNSYNMTCGFKPFPQLGCQIGRCVNGAWEQVCR